MYGRTSFKGAHRLRVQKLAKFEKGYVFGHIDKFWKGHDTQIKKNACKNAYLGSIFIPEKYVLRVCFESTFTRMISSLKYKWPPRKFTFVYMYTDIMQYHVLYQNSCPRWFCCTWSSYILLHMIFIYMAGGYFWLITPQCPKSLLTTMCIAINLSLSDK